MKFKSQLPSVTPAARVFLVLMPHCSTIAPEAREKMQTNVKRCNIANTVQTAAEDSCDSNQEGGAGHPLICLCLSARWVMRVRGRLRAASLLPIEQVVDPNRQRLDVTIAGGENVRGIASPLRVGRQSRCLQTIPDIPSSRTDGSASVLCSSSAVDCIRMVVVEPPRAAYSRAVQEWSRKPAGVNVARRRGTAA
jgi:hypothetical protein